MTSPRLVQAQHFHQGTDSVFAITVGILTKTFLDYDPGLRGNGIGQ